MLCQIFICGEGTVLEHARKVQNTILNREHVTR